MGNVWDIKARYKAAMNNEIRGDVMLFGGGSPGSDVNTIQKIAISNY